MDLDFQHYPFKHLNNLISLFVVKFISRLLSDSSNMFTMDLTDLKMKRIILLREKFVI